MIKKLFSWLKTPLGGIPILIFALIVLSGAVWGISRTQTSPQQPIQFPHQRHVALGIQCLYCHPGASRGPAAG